MPRPFTVYFDTSFFIELGKADENSANKIIDRLNSIKVRHVLSQTVMDELLRRTDTLERDAILFQRVSRLEIEPYLTMAWIKWNMLLLSTNGREVLANAICQWDSLSLYAESLSGLARRSDSSEDDEDMRKALRNIQQALDLPEDPMLAAKEVWSRIANLPPEIGLDLTGLKVPDVITPESANKFSLEVTARIPKFWFERFIEGEKIHDSTMTGDNRPYRLVVDKASDNERRRLASEIRDQKHILEFVQHCNDIDLLQVDHTQFNRITQSTSKHRLVELDLSERCFWATNLKDAVDKVQSLLEMIEGRCSL